MVSSHMHVTRFQLALGVNRSSSSAKFAGSRSFIKLYFSIPLQSKFFSYSFLFVLLALQAAGFWQKGTFRSPYRVPKVPRGVASYPRMRRSVRWNYYRGGTPGS